MTKSESHPSAVSIVIPAWHEAGRIGPTLRRLALTLSSAQIAYEILVVCDGGDDGTTSAVGEVGDPRTRVVVSDRRLGKGGAIIEGFQKCRHPVIGFVDADCAFPKEEILALIDQVALRGCVIGSRFVKRGDVRSSVDPRPLNRIILSQFWRIFVRVLFNMRVSDTQCGAKFFDRDSILPILPTIVVTGWTFDVSLLYHSMKAGIRITEVPVSLTHGDGSKLDVPKVVPAMLISAIGLRLVNSSFRLRIPPQMIRQIQKLMNAS